MGHPDRRRQKRSPKETDLNTTVPEPVFASIDIGSHTIRLLIAQLGSKHELAPLRTERRITRLARGFQDRGPLEAGAIRESLAVLKEYAAIMGGHGVRSSACGATGVVRRAANGQAFLQEVLDETGIHASILSEDSEAYLSAKGIYNVLPSAQGLLLMFDLGGSSTEFLLADSMKGEVIWSTSVFVGASTVTQRSLTGDPPAPSQVEHAVDAIRCVLDPALVQARAVAVRTGCPPSPFRIVGTAGTATTLAAMFLEMTVYEPYRVNGLTLREEWLEALVGRLSRSTLDLRRKIQGLEPGREDIILGGALIVREILRGLGQQQLVVTDGGLLEGLLLDHIEETLDWPRSFVSPLTWRLQKG